MKTRLFLWAAIVSVIIVIGFAGSCGTTGAGGKLSGEELRSLLAGKTIHKNSPGRIKSLKLKKNGEMIITDYQGKKFNRKWFMERTAWCITKFNHNKECYFVYDLGDGKYDVRRARDDTSVGIVTISE
ncbi:MAG: hypothetical protein PVG60_05055 [Desulfarculaceae bacterium]|jgi:hypothetical protein